MAGEIIIYCNNLEEVNKELELLLRDHYSVVVEQAENVWNYFDGRIRLIAKLNKSLAYKPPSKRY